MSEAIEKYYQDLLIVQYHNKPKAQQTIQALVGAATGDGIFEGMLQAFDFDTAVGVQLDIIGKLIGVNRSNLNISDGIYRDLLKIKNILNNSNATMKAMDDVLYQNFGDKISVVNNFDMTITYIISGEYTELLNWMLYFDLLPAPNGVGASYIQLPDLPDTMFGFNTKYVQTTAIGFSTKDEMRDGTFLSKENLV